MHSPELVVEDNRRHKTRYGAGTRCRSHCTGCAVSSPARHRPITQKCPASSHRGQIASGGTIGATVKGAASRGKERSRGSSLLVGGIGSTYSCVLVWQDVNAYTYLYTESKILQIQALVTNGVLSCIRAGTWDTECIHTCVSSTTITSNTVRKKNATAIERQLFVQDLVALKGPDRLISNVLPGVRG